MLPNMLPHYKMFSMRSLSAKQPIRTLRKICGLTQADLAEIIGCARLTIHNLEVEKLSLSRKMAEKLSVHTGIKETWLLNPKRELPPVCQRDPKRPYSKEAFDITRADVLGKRSAPMDVRAIQNFLAVAYHRLNDAALQAYDTNKVVYFNYCLREFLEELDRRWPDSRAITTSMNVADIAAQAASLFEKMRQKKVRSKPK